MKDYYCDMRPSPLSLDSVIPSFHLPIYSVIPSFHLHGTASTVGYRVYHSESLVRDG